MRLNLVDYDILYLSRAFYLARRGCFTTSPNPNVGCVIVRDNKIVGQGYHVCSGGDHAEIYALRTAGSLAYNSTVYITLEPCCHYGKTPPCVLSLIRAGVKRVVISMLDPNPSVHGMGVSYLREAGIDVKYGVMLSDAELLNKGFLKRMRTGLPRIRVKLASSLDGRIGMYSGRSKWITSVQSRKDVQKFRAESDVILSTSMTVVLDNPMLNVRWSFLPEIIKNIYPKNKIRQPMRVIIDSTNRVRPEHRVIQSSGKVLLVRAEKDDLVWPKSVEHLLLPLINYEGNNYLDLLSLMKELGRKGINNVLVEAGATLFCSLLNMGLVDELILYQANKFLGHDAQPLCLLSGVECFSEVVSFKLLDLKRVGPDIRLRLEPHRE